MKTRRVAVKKHGVILSPTSRSWENRAVLNPGIYQQDNKVEVVYRAVDKGFISRFGYAEFDGPLKLVKRWQRPLWSPKTDYESHGIEDPRITKIRDEVYLTYVAHDGQNAQIAYAYGPDLKHLQRGGRIGPCLLYSEAAKLWDRSKLKDSYYFFESYYLNYAGSDVLVWEKDGTLFPEKFGGFYALTHRIYPDVQIIYFRKFSELKTKKFWIDYFKRMHDYVMLEGRHGWEERHIGAGAPPLKTRAGWLMIYHGVEEINKKRFYHAGVALTDLQEPKKVIARLTYPLFSATRDYEMRGQVANVVFPTGTAIFGNQLYIYYGAADNHIAVASVNLPDLLEALKRNRLRL